MFAVESVLCCFFFFSSRRRHTRSLCDWSSDVCSSDLELFRQIKNVRSTLTLTIIFGVLGAVAMIAQMAFLSRIVDRVFLARENLAQVSYFLFLLLSAVVVRAGLVWAREVTAQWGAIRVKS